jgi:heat-inducible transcriptional repressor
MVVERLSERMMVDIQRTLVEISGGIDRLLRIVSHLVSRLSGGVGIILTPVPLHARLTSLKLVPVSYRRMLIVLELDIGSIRTVIAELQQDMSDDQLATAEEILNARLVGLTLQEIQTSIVPRLKGTLADDLGITAVILGHSTELFEDQSFPEIYTHGLPQALKSPEFDDQSNVYSLVSLIEDERRLRALFGAMMRSSEVKVTIGTEHQDQRMEILASISSGYAWGHTVGSMAVLAPKRVLYPHVVALMEYLSSAVSEMDTSQN